MHQKTNNKRYDNRNLYHDAKPRQAGGSVHNGITAVIAYDAEIVEDKGDYWTAPSWSIEDETVAVEAVINEDGNEDEEAAEWLEKQLN